MKTRTTLLAKFPHNTLPSEPVSPKLCEGGPKLGDFTRAEAG